MSARATPYAPPGQQVRIAANVWMAALSELRRYADLPGPTGTPGSEGLVYLGGIPAAGGAVVTTVLRLQHVPQGDRVAPTTEEVRWLISTLRDRDEKLIAQFHTHRRAAFHSTGDDRMATSFHDGFLSIVAPTFAMGVERVDQCAVHEYRDGSFHVLDPTEVTARFIVFDPVVDRRPAPEPQEQSIWQRFVQRLRSIVPNRL